MVGVAHDVVVGIDGEAVAGEMSGLVDRDLDATAQYGALTLREGMHYYSNTPYMRPLLTIITDTVDHENLKKLHGPMAEHSFIYPAGRCHAAMHEQAFGEPNLNCCDFNLLQGIVDVAGKDVALQTPIPNAFMHFQPVAYDQVPMNYSMYSSEGVFRRGDHVELLAHDDLFVAVSLCPSGDQYDMSSKDSLTTYPVAVKIYEGPDGSLETAADPGFRSMTHAEFIEAGCPSTPSGHVGGPDSPTAFRD